MKEHNKFNKHQLGFSLVEIFVALSIGLVLFAGVLSIFVGMRTTTAETSAYGELQENGRFAISLLTDDLVSQDFWGDYAGTLDRSSLQSVPAAPGNDCQGGGVNNTSFPTNIGSFRTIWGETVSAIDPMGCFEDAKLGSDVIQLKRVIANPLNSLNNLPAGNYYLTTNLSDGVISAGGAVPPVIVNSQSWEYQHHVYYVREETQGNNTVPVLMQGQLTTQMSFQPIIDGIEMIRFMFGVDTTGNGIVNAFISADNMTDAYWDKSSTNQILSVKIYVLARNVLPDNKYSNANTYSLGDLDVTFNDNYRRLLFSSTITLHNSRTASWPPD